jgi:hypothetical protein
MWFTKFTTGLVADGRWEIMIPILSVFHTWNIKEQIYRFVLNINTPVAHLFFVLN